MRRGAARTLRAMPTLLRVGVAETVAYRAEFLVWILTTTQPLIMLGLWTFVAGFGTFGGYSANDFTAYFLADLIVRQLTGNWVAWQLMEDIRLGTMSMRLLRPIHPFFAYASSHVAAIPFRAVVMLPIAFILLVSSGASSLTTDPAQIIAFVPSLLLAWLITFCVMFALGSLAFFITQTSALADVYFGLFQIFSGYIMPLEIMPRPIQVIASWLPFKYTLAVPIQLLTKSLSPHDIAVLLAQQAAWTAIMLAVAMSVWRLGIKRYEAVGN
ncbi:MAG TPA: ABC-2 family transporter protein [Kofleriaceae bacterium]|nr:ABC-2 family transporter protein [Kofleriaceae bacterium]